MAAGGAPADRAPTHWDFTLLPFAALIRQLLDAVEPAAVVEVGADRGDFTAELLDWAAASGAKLIAVDPEPAPELLRLAESHPELTLLRERSPEALGQLPPTEAMILDGDHNYHTLSGELAAIAGRAEGTRLPLLLIHDIGWPHARRDTYYAPEDIPERGRQPLAPEGAMVAPGEPGTASAGIAFPAAAAREGGERNGVLTAVEDFVAERPGLRLATVPAFFGLGVLWPQDAPWAGAVDSIVAPWEGNPLLERLETLRVAQIVDRVRMHRQEEVLREQLASRGFGLAGRVSRLLRREGSGLSRERIRKALGER